MKKYNVLIIDDNPDDLEFYEELLAQCTTPYHVYTAETAEEGLNLLDKKKIDCTFIDYNIPKKNGIQILEEITKDNPDYCATIMLTGSKDKKYRAEAARNNAFDFIVKDPYMKPAEIDAIIQKVIEWKNNLNKQNVEQNLFS